MGAEEDAWSILRTSSARDEIRTTGKGFLLSDLKTKRFEKFSDKGGHRGFSFWRDSRVTIGVYRGNTNESLKEFDYGIHGGNLT